MYTDEDRKTPVSPSGGETKGKPHRGGEQLKMRKTLLILAALGIFSAVASATVMIDDYTTATGGANTVQNNDPTDGCSGPSTANHNGTNIMGGSGTRNMSISRTSGAGTRCVQAVVDQATTFNDLQMNSDPNTSGTLTLSGSGSNYTWLAGDTGVTFLASHDLQTLVTATIQIFLHVSGGGYIGAAPLTITSGGLTLHTINLAAFNIGGTISPGTVLDGYQIIINGGLASDLVVDQIQVIGNSNPIVPEPATMILMGGGLLGLALFKRWR